MSAEVQRFSSRFVLDITKTCGGDPVADKFLKSTALEDRRAFRSICSDFEGFVIASSVEEMGSVGAMPALEPAARPGF